MEDSPVEGSSVEGSPVEGSPVEGSSMEDSPVKDSSVEDWPVEGSVFEETWQDMLVSLAIAQHCLKNLALAHAAWNVRKLPADCETCGFGNA
jgi:hypothetical protein